MRYLWNEFCLDPEGALLTKQGRQMDASKKVLACIGHLIEQRHRVVGYDELILRIWGHHNVTNHQLSQIVFAARRLLGDDGENQRLIRTMTGLGYRWVAPVTESDKAAGLEPDRSAIPGSEDTPMPSASSAPEPDSSTSRNAPSAIQTIDRTGQPRSGEQSVMSGWRALLQRRFAMGAGMLAIAVSAVIVWRTLPVRQEEKRQVPASPEIAVRTPARPAQQAGADQVAIIETLIASGKADDAREALAKLSPHLANTPRARLAEIRLDLYRGRYKLALQKLEAQLKRAKSAEDPLWQVDVLMLIGSAYAGSSKPAKDLLNVSESALTILESMGGDAPAKHRAVALAHRGLALIRMGRHDEGMRDYIKSRDIYIGSGDMPAALRTRGKLARAWMHAGRLREALEELQVISNTAESRNEHEKALNALNSISRIQVELLHSEDAVLSCRRSLQKLGDVPQYNRRTRTLELSAFILANRGLLHEAESQFEEWKQSRMGRDKAETPIIAMYHLESGDMQRALAAAQPWMDTQKSPYEINLMLEDQEGSALIWMTAAQALAAQGRAMPAAPVSLTKLLGAPKTTAGRVARGRLLWSQGKLKEAEAELRLALQETQRENQTYRMTLAGEALVVLLLERGDVAGARIAIEMIHAYDPAHVERDYRTKLLELRVALAESDATRIRIIRQKVQSLAGERRLPADIENAYRTAMDRAFVLKGA